MLCPSCGAENRPGSRFCSKCGSGLSRACPACGTPADPDDRFCSQCGATLTVSDGGPTRVQAPPGSVEAPAQASERRLVSVLFADLVGFTSLSESKDPEEVRELLTRYFDTCRQLIHRYGGTVEKFIGDAVMAVWGTPVAQEDDAERAVRAALDLVQAVAELGQEVGAPELSARAGVLTGEAAVSIGAEGQGMVAGDLVNTASRTQSVAEPGTIMVGEVTRRATEAAIVYEDAGIHQLKGKADPVPLWRAVRVVAGARGALKSERLEAPFVGRDRELKTVKDLFFACAEDGKAHLVSVLGVAGIGKSRLAWEFYKYVDGLASLSWYHRGRCLAYGEGVTYWALAEMVRMRARIIEGEDSASARDKLRASVEQHVQDPEERRWVEPRLAHLIGVEELAGRDREDLFAAWRLFFERLADENPTIMVFEDMQWADAALLDFIEYLLDWSRNHPIYVLTLARPELLDRRPSWGAGKRNLTSIYLEPLARADMEALLAGVVPGLPRELQDQILDRAEGVPLYAVETVRMLLDRGLLSYEGSAYRATGPIEALEVPETLQALIAARLDGLAQEERRLLQDASVLGKTFTRQAILAVAGLAGEEADRILASLVRKEVLSIQADVRSPERGQYGFLQDLVRMVAYDTLSKKQRKAKHLAAAAYLEGAWGAEEEEIVEVVASHYLEAHRAAPFADDAADIKARAQGMLARAGERAASLAANEEARRYFEQAVELVDEPLAQAALHERAGQMAWAGAAAEAAATHFEQAIALFESQGASHPAARVSARLGELDWRRGRLEEAAERMEQAFGVLSTEELDEDLAAFAAELARLHFFRGRADLAGERIEFALDIAERLWLPEIISQSLNTKALIAGSRGRAEETVALLKHALEVALENDVQSAAIRAYNNLGDALGRRDRYEDAQETYRSGIALARKVGNRVWESNLMSEVTYPLSQTGQWDEAVAQLAEMPEADPRTGYLVALTTSIPLIHAARGNLGDAKILLERLEPLEASADVQERGGYAAAKAVVLQAEGRFADAIAAGEQAMQVMDALGATSQDVKAGFAPAVEAALALQDLPKAEELISRIEALRPGESAPFLRAQTERLRALVAAVRGEAQVEPRLKAAAGMFRELDTPFWLAVTLLEHGEWLAGQGRHEEAEPLMTEAEKIFEGLQARPWLERLATSKAGPRAVSV